MHFYHQFPAELEVLLVSRIDLEGPRDVELGLMQVLLDEIADRQVVVGFLHVAIHSDCVFVVHACFLVNCDTEVSIT